MLPRHIRPLTGLLLLLPLTAGALELGKGMSLHGSVQADMLFPQADASIGADDYANDLLGNGYANLNFFSRYVDAGARLEYLQFPLPGYELNKGWGVPNIFVKGRYGGFELTVGDFYEQFGNGFILRTYEDRALGIDNSLRGARLKVSALPGFRITALGGIQRRFWDWSMRSKVVGGDVEFDLQQYVRPFADRGISWNIGASYVMRHESDEDIVVPGTNTRLNLPQTVHAFDARTHFYKSGLDLKLEYAWKGQDPSFYNHYTYRHGSAIMLSAAYSKRGMSALLQVKRSDNMSFRSRRTENEAATWLNNLPPFNYQHTYALAAHFPYATQEAPGEWAFQADFAYTFPRRTPLGGRYGTKLHVNASYIAGIDREPLSPNASELFGTDWYKHGWGGIGETYYLDANLQIEKRLTADFNFNFMYMYQKYNRTVIEGHGGIINSNIFVLEGKYRFNKTFTLRGELQYMLSDQHKPDNIVPTDEWGDWSQALLELSINPYLMVSVQDLWNHGGNGNHFYMANVTGVYRNNRLVVGYGRTRAGFNCAGGVCRWVPATRGFTVSYNYTF